MTLYALPTARLVLCEETHGKRSHMEFKSITHRPYAMLLHAYFAVYYGFVHYILFRCSISS